MTEPTTEAAIPLGAAPYKLLGAPVEVNRYDDAQGRVVSGVEVQAQWLANGAVFTVFVPDTEPLATTADTMIRARGAELDSLRALSG